MSTVHVIPVALHCRGFATRQDAVEFVERMLEMDDQQILVALPNDRPDHDWYLAWVAGTPPEAIDEQFSYDRQAGTIYDHEQEEDH